MMSEQESLYVRLGGHDPIHAFLEDVMARLMNDEETGVFWDYMSQDRVFKEHRNFVDFLCQHWGGPEVYQGRDMITVHKGMRITERHWTITFEKLDESFEKFELAQDLRDEISAFLKSFKPHIVGSPSFREVVRGPDGQKFLDGMESFGVKWP
jgi:hemoglobin